MVNNIFSRSNHHKAPESRPQGLSSDEVEPRFTSIAEGDESLRIVGPRFARNIARTAVTQQVVPRATSEMGSSAIANTVPKGTQGYPDVPYPEAA